MKKFALLFALIGIVNYSYTNSGGSPGGKSGSPASNGQTCAGGYCHGGGSATGNELVDIQVDVTPYAGSSNYSDTISDSIQTQVYLNVAAAGSSKIGFSASIEDASGMHIERYLHPPQRTLKSLAPTSLHTRAHQQPFRIIPSIGYGSGIQGT